MKIYADFSKERSAIKKVICKLAGHKSNGVKVFYGSGGEVVSQVPFVMQNYDLTIKSEVCGRCEKTLIYQAIRDYKHGRTYYGSGQKIYANTR